MIATMVGFRLTIDELAAVADALGVTSLPGVTSTVIEGTSPEAGQRSLVARGLFTEIDGEMSPTEPVAVVLAALAAAETRATIHDASLVGEVATISILPGAVVLHRPLTEGVHDVVVLDRDAGREAVAALLNEFDGAVANEAGAPAELGRLVLVTAHSSGPGMAWHEELALWIGTDGTAIALDVETGGTEAIIGAGTRLIEQLFG
jgi:hypothetical protein